MFPLPNVCRNIQSPAYRFLSIKQFQPSHGPYRTTLQFLIIAAEKSVPAIVINITGVRLTEMSDDFSCVYRTAVDWWARNATILHVHRNWRISNILRTSQFDLEDTQQSILSSNDFTPKIYQPTFPLAIIFKPIHRQPNDAIHIKTKYAMEKKPPIWYNCASQEV